MISFQKMRKNIPFEIWKEQNLKDIQFILDIIEVYLNKSTFPKHMNIEYYFHEDLEDKIIRYIYDHSSTKYVPH